MTLIFLIVCCLLCPDVSSLAVASEADCLDASSLLLFKGLLSSVWFVLVAVVDLYLLLSGNIRSTKPRTLHVKH